MRLEGRVEVGPYAAGSKSARRHQAFLVTDDGERLLLRRYDGPSMRDETLEALAGSRVAAEGLRRADLFLARSLHAVGGATGPGSGTAPSGARGRAKRKP